MTSSANRVFVIASVSDDLKPEKYGNRIPDRTPNTWPAELPPQPLLPRLHVQAPAMEGKAEKLLQPQRWTDGAHQPLQPLLTLIEGGELAPYGSKTKY